MIELSNLSLKTYKTNYNKAVSRTRTNKIVDNLFKS